MVTYEVEFTDASQRDLTSLDRTEAQRALDRLRWLADNAESVGHRALTAQLRGAFSLRSGDYRVIYSLVRAQHKIIVHMVRHRSEVYRLR